MFSKMAGPAGTLNVNDGGSGRVPVLFLHSAVGNANHWSAQLEHVRKKRRAVAPDLRGHGLSHPPADADYRFESQAEDIHAIVTKLGLRRVILAGHDMGGSIAIAYAGLHPDRVAGLLLVDTGGDPRQFPAAQVAQLLDQLESDAYPGAIEEYYRKALVGSRHAVRERILRELRSTRRDMLVGVIREQFRFDPLPALLRHAGPMLSIVTPRGDIEYGLHRLVPALEHIEVPGAGHWIHLDKPEEFNRILDGFVRLVDAEAPVARSRAGT